MGDAARAAQTAAGGVPAPLARGDEGEQVERLQHASHALGLFPDKALANQRGAYSGETAAAVKALQARAGLAPTGAVDGGTWAALRDEAGPAALWGAPLPRHRSLSGPARRHRWAHRHHRAPGHFEHVATQA
jgi:peptidoglycan hydrolase-like protein with peptidoglycan-binding domain